MLKDLEISRYGAGRTHRTYTREYKAELVAARQKPSTSIAALTNAHGMNVNVLHRWLKEHACNGTHQLSSNRGAVVLGAGTVQPALPAFIALALPVAASEPVQHPAAPPLAIRIEVQRANTTIVVNWALSSRPSAAWSEHAQPR